VELAVYIGTSRKLISGLIIRDFVSQTAAAKDEVRAHNQLCDS
jgi:hypothetical protein